ARVLFAFAAHNRRDRLGPDARHPVRQLVHQTFGVRLAINESERLRVVRPKLQMNGAEKLLDRIERRINLAHSHQRNSLHVKSYCQIEMPKSLVPVVAASGTTYLN